MEGKNFLPFAALSVNVNDKEMTWRVYYIIIQTLPKSTVFPYLFVTASVPMPRNLQGLMAINLTDP